MKRNSRLSLALHTLGHMAANPERVRTSAEIAAHAQTNPVVVRRVLGHFRDAGILISEKGHSGGWKLARAPEQISLADIYLALDEPVLSANISEEKADCGLERRLRGRVGNLMSELEDMMIKRLSNMTIAQLIEK